MRSGSKSGTLSGLPEDVLGLSASAEYDVGTAGQSQAIVLLQDPHCAGIAMEGDAVGDGHRAAPFVQARCECLPIEDAIHEIQ